MREIEYHEMPKEIMQKAKVVGNILAMPEKIEDIVSDDFCEQLDWDVGCGHITDERLIAAQKKLSRIYRLVHSNNPNHSCFNVHDNWRRKP